MPNTYRNQPISGFTGYIPGAKWQVGSRYVPQKGVESENTYSSKKEGLDMQQEQKYVDKTLLVTKNAGQLEDKREEIINIADLSNEELQERLTKLKIAMQNIQTALSIYKDAGPTENVEGEPGSHQQLQKSRQAIFVNNDNAAKPRSKSVPRSKKIEGNPFDGVESGWWSKGEVRRNKERREIVNGGHVVTGGNWNQRPTSMQRNSNRIAVIEKNTTDDIPTAGYSGHIQGIRHIGVGKPFNLAAKQAKKEYIERRRAYNGSRDMLDDRPRLQYSDEEVLTNLVKLPDRRF